MGFTKHVEQPDLFIFAGETSGDLHGEALLHNLYLQNPQLKISGVGGPKMRKFPIENILSMENFQVMGFIDVLLALPTLYRYFRFLLHYILQANPKAVVFIDYPGFALRMEKKLKKQGFKGKIIHYICPSVWAWGKKRIPTMEKTIDLLLSILPFEKNCFSSTFPIRYIGHPLVSRIKHHSYHPLAWGEGKKIVSLFPGSRKKEILRNFPLELQVLKILLEQDPDIVGAISVSQDTYLPLLQKLLKEADLPLGNRILLVSSSRTYDLMQQSFLALAKCGTVTLELALHLVPTIVLFAISPLDLFLAQKVFRISLPFYSLPNITLNKEVFAEFIGPNATVDKIQKEATKLAKEESYRKEKKALCKEVLDSLGSDQASQKAAEAIVRTLETAPVVVP